MSKTKENIIKTITIDIAGTEVEVTPQQAKDLHAALGGLLGLDKPKEVKIIERETVRDKWYPYWPYGSFTYTKNAETFDKFRITYSNGTANALLKIS